MPLVRTVEKKIHDVEGLKVHFIHAGKNVRSDADIPMQYAAKKMSKNSVDHMQLSPLVKGMDVLKIFTLFQQRNSIERPKIMAEAMGKLLSASQMKKNGPLSLKVWME